MKDYDGPSFLKHTYKQIEHTSTERLKNNMGLFQTEDEKANDRKLFKEKTAHTLPSQIKKRNDIEKGFQEYLNERKSNPASTRSEHYIEPPFEASKVPSPIFGYKQPALKQEEKWSYEQLKQELEKPAEDFILFEEFATPELRHQWNIEEQPDSEKHQSLDNTEKSQYSQQPKTLKEQFSLKDTKSSENSTNKRMRLKRSLMHIIQEEQLGNNEKKRNIPGFFSDENE